MPFRYECDEMRVRPPFPTRPARRLACLVLACNWHLAAGLSSSSRFATEMLFRTGWSGLAHCNEGYGRLAASRRIDSIVPVICPVRSACIMSRNRGQMTFDTGRSSGENSTTWLAFTVSLVHNSSVSNLDHILLSLLVALCEAKCESDSECSIQLFCRSVRTGRD
jgi:hypothetical protein